MIENLESLDFALFEKMDAFWFSHYAINHPEDIERTSRFFDNCDGVFVENVMMYCDMLENYRWN